MKRGRTRADGPIGRAGPPTCGGLPEPPAPRGQHDATRGASRARASAVGHRVRSELLKAVLLPLVLGCCGKAPQQTPNRPDGPTLAVWEDGHAVRLGMGELLSRA